MIVSDLFFPGYRHEWDISGFLLFNIISIQAVPVKKDFACGKLPIFRDQDIGSIFSKSTMPETQRKRSTFRRFGNPSGI